MTLDSLLDWGLAIVGGGGIGSVITFFSTYKTKRRLNEESVRQAEIDTANAHGIMEKDRFEAMYQQITDMAKDYNELSDQFRDYRKTAMSIEAEFTEKLRQRSRDLATLKDQVHHLKRLRCYDLDCPKRIKNNPEE